MDQTYWWNTHEQLEKKQLPTAPKIKLLDDPQLRLQLEVTLEQLPHALIAEWSIQQALLYLRYLEPPLQKDPRIQRGIGTLQRRISWHKNPHRNLANTLHASSLKLLLPITCGDMP
ncbi:hypothetical protein [Enterococcus sp. AZ109]|uniref:hypothetical protein n=1 Tax=Enterococcus sp. AZ109 TaxID=2774634 RepID=UPI003F2555DA